MALAVDGPFIGSPQWNPQGDKLAFLAASGSGAAKAIPGKPSPGKKDSLAKDTSAAKVAMPAIKLPDGSGELRVFDFPGKKLLSATQESRVRSFSWSVDGKRVFYSAGVNLADINAFNLDSMTLGKVTHPAASPRSEENPVPKILGGRDGLLFESGVADRRNILWMDLSNQGEKVLVDSAGYNALK